MQICLNYLRLHRHPPNEDLPCKTAFISCFLSFLLNGCDGLLKVCLTASKYLTVIISGILALSGYRIGFYLVGYLEY